MRETGLTLHHNWSSTCSQKVRLCLAEKGLEWEGRALDLRALDHLDPAFLALNPAGMVPVLEHADHGTGETLVLTESSVINEYLEDAFPETPLMPADAAGRARVRAWTKFIDDVPTDAIKVPSYQQNLRKTMQALTPAQKSRIRDEMPNRKTAERWLRLAEDADGLKAEDLEAANRQLTETLERMTADLARHAWLAGDGYSLADVNMAPFVDRIDALEDFDLAGDWPEVARWLEALRARPAFAEARFADQRRPTPA